RLERKPELSALRQRHRVRARPGRGRESGAGRFPGPVAGPEEGVLRLFHHRFKAMGGPCELQLYADTTPDAAFAHGEAEVRRLEAGMELDFGGIVKEYAADRAAAVLREAGARHGLAALGGDLAVVGAHPDGTPWHVGIRHPRDPEHAVASIPLAAGGIASSGD